ncbi:MAG: hypothetical protein VYE22_12770 [Myxococcota bacterium]|nr:hypothetical protein [Myxococcota bacterium]
MSDARRRIWSELVPLPALARSSALEALAARGVQLLVAVWPGQEGDARRVVARAAELELSVGLWPQLPDEEGRWLNPGNAAPFEAWTRRLLDAIPEPIDTLALDLEPPIAELRRLTEGRLGAARAWLRRPLDDAPHRRLVAAARARGLEVLAAVVPPVLLPGRAGRGWQRALGSPLDAGYDAVSAMLYTTLFEGYGFGVVHRPDARALLDRFARDAARLGDRASVSLGAIGTGALGDERTYRDPAELADDVRIARAAGLRDLALFDLSGALTRPPLERWLDAFLDPGPAAAAPSTRRARAALGLASVLGVALDVHAGRG